MLRGVVKVSPWIRFEGNVPLEMWVICGIIAGVIAVIFVWEWWKNNKKW